MSTDRQRTNIACFCCRRYRGHEARIRVDVGGQQVLDEKTSLCSECASNRFSVAIVADRLGSKQVST